MSAYSIPIFGSVFGIINNNVGQAAAEVTKSFVKPSSILGNASRAPVDVSGVAEKVTKLVQQQYQANLESATSMLVGGESYMADDPLIKQLAERMAKAKTYGKETFTLPTSANADGAVNAAKQKVAETVANGTKEAGIFSRFYDWLVSKTPESAQKWFTEHNVLGAFIFLLVAAALSYLLYIVVRFVYRKYKNRKRMKENYELKRINKFLKENTNLSTRERVEILKYCDNKIIY